MANKKVRRGVSVYIDDKKVKSDVRSVQKEYYKLRNLQKDMTIGSEEYNRTTRKIKRLKGILDKHNNQLRTTSRRWSGMGSSAAKARQKVMGMMAKLAAIGGSLMGIQRLVRANAELSDSLADVQKTTNMTAAEVEQLNKNIMNINTRTSRKELLDLGRIAGKLGVTGVKNVEGFINAADKINVSLKEDLGGNTEESIRQIGKLVDIFKVEEQFGLEQGLLKMGSAINELGASSTANEAFLVNFSNRMAGIAPNAEISADKVLGLAATLDQLGQREEMSATALGQLMVAMGEDVPKFAEIAGESIEDFSTLLREDANEALLRVLEGSKSTGEGLEGMAKSMDALGLDGQRAIQVMGVLSNNTELLREQQNIANEAYDEGTSLTEEFNKKNENLAALLAKIGKRLKAYFVNSDFLNGIKTAVSWVERWTRADMAETIREEGDEINRLAVKLTDSNTKEKERREILQRMEATNKKTVEGLDAENISLEKLRENLEEYNNQLVKRMTIANLEEDEEKALLKLQKHRNREARAKAELTKLMFEANKDLALSEGTFGEKIQKVNKYLQENAAGMKKVSTGVVIDTRNKESKLLEKLNREYRFYAENQKKANAAQEESGDLEERMKQLKQILGLNEEINEEKTGGKGEPETEGESGKVEVVDEESVKEQEKILERLQKEIEDFQQKLMLDSKSGKDKELAELDIWYDEMKAKAKEAGADVTKIENLYEEKKAAITDKYEQQRLDKKKEVQERISEIMLDDKQKEIHEVTEKYQELIDLAEEFGIDTVELYEKMQNEIKKIRDGEEDEDEPSLFGISVSDFEEMAGEINAIISRLGGDIMSIWNNVAQRKNNLDQQELNRYQQNIERQKSLLNNQLEEGAISQEQYNARVAKLETNLDEKKREIAERQAERDKKAAKFSAYINAAEAITQIWSKHAANPVMAAILTALAVAKTATQIAAIESQPVPEYAEGGFTNGDRIYRAGEGGRREWIGNNQMVNDPVTGPLIHTLEDIQRGRMNRDVLRPAVVPDYGAMKKAASGISQSSTTHNYYQQGNEDMKTLITEVRGLKEENRQMKEDNRELKNYMSDPRNRRASISFDLQNETDEEINNLRSLSEI